MNIVEFCYNFLETKADRKKIIENFSSLRLISHALTIIN